MKVLVLGAENEIGAAFLQAAAARGIDSVAVSGRRVDLGSARRIGRMLRRHRPDVVLNAVDFLPEDDDASLPRLQQIIRDGAHNIAKAAHGRDTPLIHLSSDAVFGGCSGPCTELHAPAPVDAYGRAHLEAETRILQDIPRALILRNGWVFSAHPEGRLQGLLRLFAAEEPVTVDLDAQFAPTAAADVARVLVAILLQISCGIEPWGVYHYCAADIVSWKQFLDTIAESQSDLALAGRLGRIESSGDQLPPFPLRAGAQLNCQKLLHQFGIRQRAWGDGLQQVLGELSARQATADGKPEDAGVAVAERDAQS